jgi:hypothetical protein
VGEPAGQEPPHRRPEKVALREQILALLRDRHVLTTTEIREAPPCETAIHRACPALAAHFGAPPRATGGSDPGESGPI